MQNNNNFESDLLDLLFNSKNQEELSNNYRDVDQDIMKDFKNNILGQNEDGFMFMGMPFIYHYKDKDYIIFQNNLPNIYERFRIIKLEGVIALKGIYRRLNINDDPLLLQQYSINVRDAKSVERDIVRLKEAYNKNLRLLLQNPDFNREKNVHLDIIADNESNLKKIKNKHFTFKTKFVDDDG
tara:strand:- start:86 stop:634 length:549 start_codon:yes stop_codon:yes gene_type:complete